jgi:hypothetical protein
MKKRDMICPITQESIQPPKKSKKKRHYCTVSVDVTNHDAQIHEMYSNKIQKWTATYVVPCHKFSP